MLLLKQLIIILIAVSLSYGDESSIEQYREVEIDDLIKTLEERMKANRESSAESSIVTNSWDHEGDLRGVVEGQQIINQPVGETIKRPLHGQDNKKGEDARDKRKIIAETASGQETKVCLYKFHRFYRKKKITYPYNFYS